MLVICARAPMWLRAMLQMSVVDAIAQPLGKRGRTSAAPPLRSSGLPSGEVFAFGRRALLGPGAGRGGVGVHRPFDRPLVDRGEPGRLRVTGILEVDVELFAHLADLAPVMPPLNRHHSCHCSTPRHWTV